MQVERSEISALRSLPVKHSLPRSIGGIQSNAPAGSVAREQSLPSRSGAPHSGAKTTKISWTDKTWNPTTGCSRVSAGCDHCYAEALSLRMGWSKKEWTAANADENIVLHPDRLKKPYSWKEPVRVFVNSMSDLFHPKIPKTFVDEVFKVMNDLPRHTFQILTKRPRRAASYRGSQNPRSGEWTENIWMGTSIENQATLYRIDQIRKCPAKTRFLSLEPLLEPLGKLDLDGIHWVIVGGESGPGYRPMDHEWARDIRDQCVERNIPFFFKQSASNRPGMGTALIEADGSENIWHNFPSTTKWHLSEEAPVAVPTATGRKIPSPIRLQYALDWFKEETLNIPMADGGRQKARLTLPSRCRWLIDWLPKAKRVELDAKEGLPWTDCNAVIGEIRGRFEAGSARKKDL